MFSQFNSTAGNVAVRFTIVAMLPYAALFLAAMPANAQQWARPTAGTAASPQAGASDAASRNPIGNQTGNDTAVRPVAPASYTPIEWPDQPSLTSIVVRLVFGTVIVLAFSVGTLWFGKKWLNGPVHRPDPTGKLQVIESVSLGNRAAVHLIQVGNSRALAGTDAGGLQALLELSEPFGDVLTGQLGDDEAEDEAETDADTTEPESGRRFRLAPAE